MLGRIPKDLAFEAIQDNPKYLTVIEQLNSAVEAEPRKGTNIIDIRVVAEDPAEAAKVANEFAHAYREYNIQEKNKKTFETKNFIEEQLRLTSTKLRQAEKELQVFKEGYALISLDAQTQNTLDRLNSVETEYEKVKTESEEVTS